MLLLLALVWVISFLINVSQRANFADPNLEQAVREYIDKPEGQLYVSDLRQITSFSAISLNITDISGLSPGSIAPRAKTRMAQVA